MAIYQGTQGLCAEARTESRVPFHRPVIRESRREGRVGALHRAALFLPVLEHGVHARPQPEHAIGPRSDAPPTRPVREIVAA